MDTPTLNAQNAALAAELKAIKNQRRRDIVKLASFSIGFFGGVYGTLLVLNKAPHKDDHKHD
jgi:hypothetical protein